MTSSPVITSKYADTAQRIIDDLASEIDLHFEDDELPAFRRQIENLQALQRAISRPSSDVLDHIVARLKVADRHA
jgi:hypothetical protein